MRATNKNIKGTETMNTSEQKTTAKRITRTCADSWELSHIELLSASRRADIVAARDSAILLIKRQTNMTNEAIGKFFNRHVSAITYSLKRSREGLV